MRKLQILLIILLSLTILTGCQNGDKQKTTTCTKGDKNDELFEISIKHNKEEVLEYSYKNTLNCRTAEYTNFFKSIAELDCAGLALKDDNHISCETIVEGNYVTTIKISKKEDNPTELIDEIKKQDYSCIEK